MQEWGVKASRLLSLLMLLQSRGRCTAPELAAALEVSQRTILRDIDQLSGAGVPVWGEPGRHGGFQLRAGWSTSLTGVTEPESRALLLAGLPTAATALGLGAPAASVRHKLLAALPPEWRMPAEQVAQRLHVDPHDWYRSPDTPAFLQPVAEAVWNSHALTVTYSAWRGASERLIEPLGLVTKAGTWYAVARTRGTDDVRTYRLASIRSLRALPGPFRRPRNFDLAAYWIAARERFEAQLRPLEARVALSPRGMRWLENTRAAWRADPRSCRVPVPAGWTAVLLPIESIEQGTRHLLGWGTQALVRGPAPLRRAMREALAQMQAGYVD